MSKPQEKFIYEIKAESPEGLTSSMTETESAKSAANEAEHLLDDVSDGGAVTIVKRRRDE